MRRLKQNSGITLIALVITIIILLILAGITINLVIGNNGIIGRTIQAKQDYERETVREEVTLILTEYLQENIQSNKDLQSYLEEQVIKGKIESVEDSEGGIHTIIINNYMVTIDDETLQVIEVTKAKARPKINNIKITIELDGIETQVKENQLEIGTPVKITFDVTFEEGNLIEVNIGTLVDGIVEYTTNGTEMEVDFVVTGKIGEEEIRKRQKISLDKYYQKSEIEASDIKENPIQYYGELVSNYVCYSNGVEAWRIFYADERNIYLIADDYIAANDVPNSPNGIPVTENSTYKLSFKDMANDEIYAEGSKWIVENSKANKWIEKYISNYPESINENIKMGAFLVDTNVWSDYYAGKNAEYAIGSPTIELFSNSYRDTHPDQYIECEATNSYGYQLKWNTEASYGNVIRNLSREGEFNSIYVKASAEKASAMSLASPSGQFKQFLMRVGYNGLIYTDGSFDNRSGVRPIVCLKSETKLRKTVKGYEIVD